MSTKVTTLRLAAEVAAELAVVARVEGTTVSDLVRAAIEKEIAARRADPAFKQRFKERLEEDYEIFERLAK